MVPDRRPGEPIADLSTDEARGFVRPLRRLYVHEVCGTTSRIPTDLAETFARNPAAYERAWCDECDQLCPVGEFVWQGTDERMGT